MIVQYYNRHEGDKYYFLPYTINSDSWHTLTKIYFGYVLWFFNILQYIPIVLLIKMWLYYIKNTKNTLFYYFYVLLIRYMSFSNVFIVSIILTTQRVRFISQRRMCHNIKSCQGYILYHEAITKTCQWDALCYEAECFMSLNPVTGRPKPRMTSALEVFEIKFIPLIFHLCTKIDFLCNKDDTL